MRSLTYTVQRRSLSLSLSRSYVSRRFRRFFKKEEKKVFVKVSFLAYIRSQSLLEQYVSSQFECDVSLIFRLNEIEKTKRLWKCSLSLPLSPSISPNEHTKHNRGKREVQRTQDDDSKTYQDSGSSQRYDTKTSLRETQSGVHENVREESAGSERVRGSSGEVYGERRFRGSKGTIGVVYVITDVTGGGTSNRYGG